MVIECQICIRQRLRLNTLRCIDDEQRAFTRSQASGHFITKIHMSGRVDEIEDVFFPVVCVVVQPYGFGFDGDATLALEIHSIEHLRGHLALAERPRKLEQSVGERGLTVIDVGDDGEVSNVT